MKLSAKSFRYLAVLAPLALGLVVGGCGGLLGALDGQGTAPAGTVITVNGSPVFIAPGTTVNREFTATTGTSQTVTITGLPAGSTVTNTVTSQSPAGTVTVTPISGTNNVTVTFNTPGTAVLQTVITSPGVAATILNSTFVVSHPQGTGTGG